MSKIYIIIVILILLVYYLWANHHVYTSIIRGMWCASDEFCNSADIENMMVYIGPNSNKKFLLCDIRKTYVIIVLKDGKILKKNVDMTVNIGASILIPFGKTKYKILLSDDNTDDININEIIPQKLYADIDFLNGKMIWRGDDGVEYAELYKDNILTETALEN